MCFVVMVEAKTQLSMFLPIPQLKEKINKEKENRKKPFTEKIHMKRLDRKACKSVPIETIFSCTWPFTRLLTIILGSYFCAR